MLSLSLERLLKDSAGKSGKRLLSPKNREEDWNLGIGKENDFSRD